MGHLSRGRGDLSVLLGDPSPLPDSGGRGRSSFLPGHSTSPSRGRGKSPIWPGWGRRTGGLGHLSEGRGAGYLPGQGEGGSGG